MNKKLTLTLVILAIYFSFITAVLAAITANEVEVGFTPGKKSQEIILNAIQNAKISIDIAAYSFTSKKIALALVRAKKNGINIRVVADKKANKRKYTAIHYLTNNKILVRLNNKYQIMHNKFMIIDGKSIETGSLNYTKAALCRNAENIIYLKEQPAIAEKYIIEFNRLWNESTVNDPSY